MLQDITPAFLRGYESYMIEAGKSTSTIGIYLRQLRAIINKAIADKVISRDRYAFSEYTIPTARNVKKALKDTEVKTLLNFKTEKPDDQKAIDFWIISYLCSGINFADLVELKPANLQGNMLVFVRAKTKRTKKKDLRPIRIGVPPQALELIKKYQNTDPTNPYLFPILEPDLTPLTIKHRTKGFLKWVNNRTKEIATELGIDVKLTTYAARHSFSTVLKRKGVPTSFIKDALGHSSETTTENYLDSFADDEMINVSNKLTDL
jgi:integrase